jgi:hypothetical protein
MAGAKEWVLSRNGFSEIELLKKTKTIKRLLNDAKFILTIYKQNWPQKAAGGRRACGCGPDSGSDRVLKGCFPGASRARHPLLTFPRFYC